MPGTVDDFIQRFSGPATMDDRDASHYLDRFASDHPQDQEFDHHQMSSGAVEYLGKLPDPDFQNASRTAYSAASPQQRQGLFGSLVNALQGRGIDPSSLGGAFGQQRGQGGDLTPDQFAAATNQLRQNHPEAMQQVVREQPWLLKAMGNPIVMGALGMVASRMMKQRVAPPPQQASGGGGIFGRLF